MSNNFQGLKREGGFGLFDEFIKYFLYTNFNMSNEQMKSNIWKLHLYQIFGAANLSMPIIVLYYLNNGLSLTEVATFASIMAILVLFLS